MLQILKGNKETTLWQGIDETDKFLERHKLSKPKYWVKMTHSVKNWKLSRRNE